MKFRPGPIDPQNLRRTFSAKIHVIDGEKRDTPLVAVLRETVTAAGIGVEKVLTYLQTVLDIQKDERGISTVDLVIPCPPAPRKLKDARKLLSQELKPFPEEATWRQRVRPRYTNSYHLIAVEIGENGPLLRFRLMERYLYTDLRAKKPRVIKGYEQLRADTFQTLLSTWLKPDLSFCSSPFQAGVLRKCAEQINSYLALLCSDADTGFPSIHPRDPKTRLLHWQKALDRIAKNTDGFAYKTARELYPDEYKANDPKGDRLINVDPDWKIVISSPIPERFPPSTTLSTQVSIFRRTINRTMPDGSTQKRNRYYVLIPVFENVNEHCPLAKLTVNSQYFWWQKCRHEFEAVAACPEAVLPEENNAVLLPLAVSADQCAERRMFELLESGHWRACIAMLSERHRHWHQRKSATKRVRFENEDGTVSRKQKNVASSRTEWWVNLSLVRPIEPVLRSKVLGIHISTEDVFHWCLMNRNKTVLQEGSFKGNPILNTALARKGKLELAQQKHRFIGGRSSGDELKGQTYQVARRIVSMLQHFDANLALENIGWVDKQGGSPEANKLFSMWNFSRLPGVISWLALRECDPPIPTVANPSNFILDFSCPSCGACRQPEQKRENADTYRENGTLVCRVCGCQSTVLHTFKAMMVAEKGVESMNKLALPKPKKQDLEE